ncbi:hypothetical protein B0A70_02390 [Chryseobacterium piscicola]|uniref:Uncharacterized protein n=1 Tax=Chryseobacterium piscicola TaxID=551459 RepID=A0A2S7KIP7_9FLAO|nr:hypothetical protein B0A70_02390 [Chryseobacterium piscicola]
MGKEWFLPQTASRSLHNEKRKVVIIFAKHNVLTLFSSSTSTIFSEFLFQIKKLNDKYVKVNAYKRNDSVGKSMFLVFILDS